MLPRALPGRPLTSALLLSLCATAHAASSPQDLAVVVVSADGATSEAAVAVAMQAEELAAATGKFAVVSLPDALEPAGTKERAKSRAEAEAAMREGVDAYNALDAQKSVEWLDRSILAFEKSDLSKTWPDYLKARLLHIASKVANGDKKGAERIDALLSLDRDAELSPTFFPPEQIAYAQRARKNLLKVASAQLEVKSTPPGAQVFVDGKLRGVTPVVVKSLVPGDHFVTLKLAGYGLAQQNAPDGAVELTLKPTAEGRAFQLLTARVVNESSAREPVAAEIAKALVARQVLLGVLKKSAAGDQADFELLRIDTKDGHHLGYAKGTAGLAAKKEWARALATVLTQDLPRTNGKPVSQTAPAGLQFDGRIPGYALLGAGVAMLATGVGFAVQASDLNSTFRETSQTSPQLPALRESATSSALIADVLMISGLVASAAGTYFGFFGPPPQPASTPSGHGPTLPGGELGGDDLKNDR
jgi:hypothetical protein